MSPKVFEAEVAERRRVIGEIESAVNANWQDEQLRLELASAYTELADFLENRKALDDSISVRSSAIDLLKDTRATCGDSIVLRTLLSTQLNGRGFTLRDQENWTEAEKDYLEILELLDGDYGAGSVVTSLLAMAQDGIGDIRDTLQDPEARDVAWERARMLFTLVLHAHDRGEAPNPASRMTVEKLLQDVIDKQNEFR